MNISVKILKELPFTSKNNRHKESFVSTYCIFGAPGVGGPTLSNSISPTYM